MQAGHALAVFEDSSTCSQCHGGAAGGGGGVGGECGSVLRWRRWCCFFLFVIFFFAGGAPNAGCAGLVAIWEDAMRRRSASRSVSYGRAPTHVAGSWMNCGIYTLMLQDTVITTLLQRAFTQLRELAFTARAVCCNLHRPRFCAARQASTSFLG